MPATLADTESGAQDCQQTEATLADESTLAGAAGSYRLSMVGGRTDGKRGSAAGSLRLVPSAFAADAFSPAANPLSGSTDINLLAVGAFPIGDPGSVDPKAPGVLVLESRQNDAPHILLRLGADANQPDSPLFDGGYTVLEVREISASGFAGVWRSAVDDLMASGHFCAWRQGG